MQKLQLRLSPDETLQSLANRMAAKIGEIFQRNADICSESQVLDVSIVGGIVHRYLARAISAFSVCGAARAVCRRSGLIPGVEIPAT